MVAVSREGAEFGPGTLLDVVAAAVQAGAQEGDRLTIKTPGKPDRTLTLGPRAKGDAAKPFIIA